MNVRSSVKRRGFTLIELMVVICLIGILASILVPNYSRARAQTQLTACTVNLQRLYAAVTMYANDNGGQWPQRTFGAAWNYIILNPTYDSNFTKLAPYVPAPFPLCPAPPVFEGYSNYYRSYQFYSSPVTAVFPRGYACINHPSTSPHTAYLGYGSLQYYPIYGSDNYNPDNTGLKLTP